MECLLSKSPLIGKKKFCLFLEETLCKDIKKRHFQVYCFQLTSPVAHFIQQNKLRLRHFLGEYAVGSIGLCSF